MLSTVSSNLKLGFISNFNEFLLEKEAKKAKDLLDISLPTLSSEANSQLAKQMLIKLTIDSPLNKRFIEERTSEIAINDYALYLGLNLDDSEDNVTKKLSYASADIGRFKQLILLSEEEKRRLKVLIKQQVQVTKKTEKTTKNHQKTPKNIAFEPFNETYLDILLNTIVASFTYLNIDSLSESFNIRELASNVIKNLHEFVQILKDGARESKKLLPIIKQIRADILSLLEQFKIPGGS